MNSITQTLALDTPSIERSQGTIIDALVRSCKRRQLIAQWIMYAGAVGGSFNWSIQSKQIGTGRNFRQIFTGEIYNSFFQGRAYVYKP